MGVLVLDEAAIEDILDLPKPFVQQFQTLLLVQLQDADTVRG